MTTPQDVTPALRQWIIEQAQAGCRPEAVLAALRSRGWEEDVAFDAINHTLQTFLGAQAAAVQALPAPVPVPEPALAGSPSSLWARDREVKVLLTMRNPRVVVFGGLLSDDECDALVAAATPRMARSEILVVETGGNEVDASRTSDGMFFGRGELPICQRVEERIAALVNWPFVNGEGLQVLHYRPGAEYKQHYDYFDSAQPGMAAVLRRGGQRVGTLVMYLNTPQQGGGTVFADVGVEVAPIKGNAVFFSYDRAHPATRSLHGGAPVLAGDKWVATKWLREGEFI